MAAGKRPLCPGVVIRLFYVVDRIGNMTDHSDVTWPSVTGKTVTGLTVFLPRPRWQRLLSWAVPSWRYRRPVGLKPSLMFDALKDGVARDALDYDSDTVKVQLTDEGFFTF